jgi:YVTN family beta-propeller protein
MKKEFGEACNIYVGNEGSNYVSIISGSTNKVIDTVTPVSFCNFIFFYDGSKMSLHGLLLI